MPRPWPVEGIAGETPVAEAAPKIIGVRLAELRHYRERALARTDAEDLHDMRVATRRLRAALRLLGGPLAEAARGVKALGDALGRVRDIDVLLGWLAEVRARAAPDELPGIDRLVEDQRQALPALEEAMRHTDERFQRELLPALLAHVGAAGFGKPLGGRLVRRAVAKRLRRVGERIARLESVDDAAGVHAARIAGKKARYDLELVEGAIGQPATDALARLKRLQELVGEVHDCDVRMTLLPERLAHADRVELPGLQRLLRETSDERHRFGEELARELETWRSDDVAEQLVSSVIGA